MNRKRETYYVKRGDDYIPVCEYDSDMSGAWKYGCHLVINEFGSRMVLQDVDPDYAAVIAAVKIYKEILLKCVHTASEARPKTGNGIPFTESQKAALVKLKEELGEHTHYFEFSSLQEIVDKSVDDFMNVVGKKYQDHPFVKKAYDNLLLKIKLCIDNEK